jgi:signal transduction histidine kinase
LPDAALEYRLRRTGLTVLAIGAFVLAVGATSGALEGIPQPGVEPSIDGRSIAAVSPAGFAWAAGIRTDQRIMDFHSAIEPGGWHLEAGVEGVVNVSSAAVAEAALRSSLPAAAVALLAGGLAVVFLRTNRRWVVPMACLALLGASVPLELLGDPGLSTASMAVAALAPCLWLAGRPRSALRRGAAWLAGGTVVLLVGAWVVARLSALEVYDTLEPIRSTLALAATFAVLAAYTVMPILRREPIQVTRPALIDAVLLAAVAGLALVAVYGLLLPPVLVWSAALLALLALPGVRRMASGRLGGALVADIRREAAEEAFEAERARMARELHDAPLQELTGVIRRLELLPEARAESDLLRRVADQLRAVATDLRPPVLDDLGLPAALDFLAEASTTDALPVLAELDDRTGIDQASRPPRAVELAAFRIAQEAVTNALRHAHPTRVTFRGRITPDLIDLSIVDDGDGISRNATREAGRRGRLGLASMRRRAEAIDADLAIDGSSDGTTIRLTWRR